MGRLYDGQAHVEVIIVKLSPDRSTMKLLFDLIAFPFVLLVKLVLALFGVQSETKPKHDNDTQNHKGWMG